VFLSACGRRCCGSSRDGFACSTCAAASRLFDSPDCDAGPGIFGLAIVRDAARRHLAQAFEPGRRLAAAETGSGRSRSKFARTMQAVIARRESGEIRHLSAQIRRLKNHLLGFIEPALDYRWRQLRSSDATAVGLGR